MAVKLVFIGFLAICFMGKQLAYSSTSRYEIASKSSRGVVKPAFTTTQPLGLALLLRPQSVPSPPLQIQRTHEHNSLTS